MNRVESEWGKRKNAVSSELEITGLENPFNPISPRKFLANHSSLHFLLLAKNCIFVPLVPR